MIISFSTTIKLAAEKNLPEPLTSGIKTVTRRNWSYSHANKLIKNINNKHQAWDKSPFCRKSRQIGWLEIVSTPYKEKLIDMPEEDLYYEGNLWESKEEFIKSLKINKNSSVWVVRFKFFSFK